MAFLIEHYEGKFPLWLAPEQIIFIPVAQIHNDYILKLSEEFKKKELE